MFGIGLQSQCDVVLVVMRLLSWCNTVLLTRGAKDRLSCNLDPDCFVVDKGGNTADCEILAGGSTVLVMRQDILRVVALDLMLMLWIDSWCW